MRELIRNDVGWEGGVVEGPFILRRGDWFYLFYSGNGCCGNGCTYALGVARSHSLLGPWEKNPVNPILAGNETWSCPGHGSLVQDESGRYFFLYHAYSTTGTIFTGREGMLDEVKFGANDWPTINNGNGPSAKAISPFGVVQKVSGASYADDFSEKNLESGWQWPQHREPIHRLENGKLLLAANGHGTNFLAAVLARSTMSADYVATATIETKLLKPGAAAGLCAFGDSENAVGAAFQDGRVIIWRRDRGETRQLAQQPAPEAAKLFLQLTARHGYRFQLAVSADGKKWMPCGDAADAKDLPPWDRSVRVALTAGGAPNAEGVFDSFAIKPLETSAGK
jgi:xylan 1,4-beta-xylosidase